MPSRKMRTAIWFFYGLDVEIRPNIDPHELFIHLGGVLDMWYNEFGKVHPQLHDMGQYEDWASRNLSVDTTDG